MVPFSIFLHEIEDCFWVTFCY